MIGDEAWDVDHFLHENPELKRVRLRLDDRLRRLAADARRRRRGGGSDGRLQRRDDRAAGPVPAASATGRSSSATPTTSCPTAFGPGLPVIRDWTEERLRLRRLRHRLRPGRLADREALCGPSSATGRTSGCASSRSAGPASASRSCGGSSTPYPLAAAAADGLRFVVVAGPTHRPGRLPRREGVDVPVRAGARTGTSPRATSPSCRAGSRRAWS